MSSLSLKIRFKQLLGMPYLLMAALVILTWTFSTSRGDSGRMATKESFVPTLEDYNRTIKDNRLANWDKLYENAPLEVVSVEIVGFSDFNNGRSMRLNVTDQKYCKLIQQSLIPGNMLRPAISDFTQYSGLIGCEEEPSFIIVCTPDAKHVVGVSCLGFQLESIEPNRLTHFYSWILAKTLDEIIHESTAQHFSEQQFHELSGEALFHRQQRAYEKRANSNTE